MILDKIRFLREWMKINGEHNVDIMVDGGINEKTAKDCIDAGAHILVAGTFLFNHPVSLEQGVHDLLHSIQGESV